MCSLRQPKFLQMICPKVQKNIPDWGFKNNKAKWLSVYDVGVNLCANERVMPQKSGDAFNVHTVLQ